MRHHVHVADEVLSSERGPEKPASAEHAAARLPLLVGEPVAAPWDPSLADAMGRPGVRIEEELCLDTLLADLS